MTEWERIKRDAVDLYLAGFHCSEAVFAAVGRKRIPGFQSDWVRLSTGFGGGVADQGDLCGAIVGGLMVIGALHGRCSPDEDDGRCHRLCRRFYRRFAERCGHTACLDIRRSIPGWTRRKCAATVERAVEILRELLG